MHQEPDRAQHCRQVEERLAHAHEHHVRDAFVRTEHLAHATDLIDDLGRGEVAREAHGARGAERAGERAPHLGRDAQRGAVVVGDQHGLDHGPVRRPEHGLARAVVRALKSDRLQGAHPPLTRQPLAQIAPEVRHLQGILDAARVEPGEDLLGAVGRLAAGRERRAQTLRIEVLQVGQGFAHPARRPYCQVDERLAPSISYAVRSRPGTSRRKGAGAKRFSSSGSAASAASMLSVAPRSR
jgi:hypothetical protein